MCWVLSQERKESEFSDEAAVYPGRSRKAAWKRRDDERPRGRRKGWSNADVQEEEGARQRERHLLRPGNGTVLGTWEKRGGPVAGA